MLKQLAQMPVLRPFEVHHYLALKKDGKTAHITLQNRIVVRVRRGAVVEIKPTAPPQDHKCLNVGGSDISCLKECIDRTLIIRDVWVYPVNVPSLID